MYNPSIFPFYIILKQISMGYFTNYIFYLVDDHSKGESESRNQYYLTPNSLNLFGMKKKGR